MAKGKEKEFRIPKEICDKVLYLDCRKDENIRSLKKALMKLPIIKSESQLETDNLEIIIKKLEKKFMFHLAYLMRSVVDCEDHYSGMIKYETTGSWIKTIYGQTTWEVYAKAVFFMFFYVEDERRKMRNRKDK
jgi:hypothetical protein